MIFLKVFVQVFRNLALLFLAFVNIFSSGLFHNVYIACKFTVLTNREMKRRDLLAVKLCQFFYNFTITDVIHIHIRYKEHTRKFIFFAQIPCLLGSHLNPGFTGNNNNCCICCADSLFYFAYKVKIAGSIKNINLHLIPWNRD